MKKIIRVSILFAFSCYVFWIFKDTLFFKKSYETWARKMMIDFSGEQLVNHPDWGWALKAPYSREVRDGHFKLSWNNVPFSKDELYGFRDPGQDDVPVFGIVLGGKYVATLDTNWEDSWVGQLNQKTNLRFVNFGMSEYGSRQLLEVFKRYGMSRKPKLIIIFLDSTDPGDNIRLYAWRLYKKEKGPTTYSVFSAQMPSQSDPLMLAAVANQVSQKTFESVGLGKEWDKLKQSVQEHWSPEKLLEFEQDIGHRLLTNDIQELNRLASSIGAKLIVIPLLPDPSYTVLNRMAEAGQFYSLHIPFPEKSESGEYPFMPKYGDFTRFGNSFVAQEVFKFLQEKNLLSPKK